jgi:hypothetical protein
LGATGRTEKEKGSDKAIKKGKILCRMMAIT